MLVQNVRTAHGVDQAATLDMGEEIGAPRGYVGTRNIALDRALGSIGIPLGRMTEISGWPNAGKSTILDQILAQCQDEGGVAVLADTEHTRNRAYMRQIGVRDESCIWIGGKTVERMFHEVETIARSTASMNAIAWYQALVRAGIKCPAPETYVYAITEKMGAGKPPKVHAKFTFAKWGREQAGALLAWQQDNAPRQSSIRDPFSRAALRPCILHTEDKNEIKEGLAAWEEGAECPYVSAADRKMVVGWDSLAGTGTDEELEGAPEDVHPATAAKVIRRNLRRLCGMIDDEGIGFVIVNQRYEKIQMAGAKKSFGPTSETYGGGGVKYHSSIRIEVDKVGDIMPPGTAADDYTTAPMGQIVRIKVPKNKIESPYHQEKFGLVFGRGAENAWAVYEDLKERGIIKVGGGWSSFTDPTIMGEHHRSFRGWTELSNMAGEDPALWATLRGLYMEAR